MRSTILFVTLACVVFSARAEALSPEARGSGMGGAYGGLANGAEGMWWNPASIGGQLLVSGLLGGSLEMGNNVLKFSDATALIANPSDANKEKVVEKVRAEGYWNADIRSLGAAAVAFKVPGAGAIGVSFFPHLVEMEVRGLTPDAVDLALSYPDLPATDLFGPVHVGGRYQRSTFAEVGVGYAREIPEPVPGLAVTAGVLFKYLHGVSYESLEAEYRARAIPPSFSGSMVRRRAGSGSGVGLDLGIHAKIMAVVNAGVAVRNVGEKIKWKGSMTEPNLAVSGLGLTVVEGAETMTSFSQDVPTEVAIDCGVKVPVVGTSLGAGVEIDTVNSANRLRVGIGQKLMAIVSVRAGYSYDSRHETSLVTLGAGIGALVAGFDLAAGFAPDQKAGMLAASGTVRF